MKQVITAYRGTTILLNQRKNHYLGAAQRGQAARWHARFRQYKE